MLELAAIVLIVILCIAFILPLLIIPGAMAFYYLIFLPFATCMGYLVRAIEWVKSKRKV